MIPEINSEDSINQQAFFDENKINAQIEFLRNSKRIALEAVVKTGYAASPETLLVEVEKIYQWLIK